MSEVLVEIDQLGIATVTLNRPDKLNAMNLELMDGLNRELERLAENRDVRCVVLTGAGRAFSAGGDVSLTRDRQDQVNEARSPGDVIDIQLKQLRRNSRAIESLLGMHAPTLAVINGHAVGGGLSLVLACDLRVAGESAQLRVGYARRGLSGDFGISFLLQMVIGGGKARELLLLDPDLSASEAKSFGLVNRVVADADLRSASAELARKLASGPTIAYGKMKENLLAAATGDFDRTMIHEAINSRITAMTADCREAAAAFAEKRTARFVGR